MKLLKKTCSLLAFILLATTVVACAGGTSSNPNELVVGIWGGNDAESAGMAQLKSDFEALNPGITLTYRLYTDYNTQIQADMISGTAPDVFYVDASLFPFFDSIGVLEPLDKQAVNADAFYDNLINTFVGASGDLYAMPKDFSTLAVYVNTDLLSDAGMTSSDIPASWEELVTFLPELQQKIDDKYGKDSVAAMTYNLELPRNLHLLTRGGAKAIDNDGRATLDDAGIINNFQIIMDLTGTGAYKRPSDLGLGWNGEAFGTGKTVIMDEGNWVYGTLNSDYSDINFEVLAMPTYKGETSSMLFTVGYGIYSQSTKKDLALKWIQFATGVDGMASWTSAAGVLPSRQDVADKINVSSDPNLQMHLDQVQHAIPWEMGQFAAIINVQYKNFMPSAVIDRSMSVQDALTQATEQANFQIG